MTAPGAGHRRVDRVAGVGDHHVQTPEPLGGGRDNRVESLAVGDIEGHRQCALAAELKGEPVEHRLAPAGQYDVGATGVERPGSGYTDAARRASLARHPLMFGS
jgi:hypothetical protein